MVLEGHCWCPRLPMEELPAGQRRPELLGAEALLTSSPQSPCAVLHLGDSLT